ncbi:NTP transferase domain-containing protein [Streptomyces winkii]|uniref:NTP transferase domain-containing protein n=1 Tax=Streptomyces winkii TaxID=3051178 RepID=UPI0028D5B62F|nr:NTP transferase domain-containing protein [Streptomyces sp. DSM 40971]
MTPDAHAHTHDAVVLAGGGARRLGGTDKPSLTVGARTLLDRVLSACDGASTTVVVGPRRPTHRPVAWVREDPPGGGPLAALDAGLRGGVNAEAVLVLSADLPFLRPETVRTLLAAVPAEAQPADGDAVEGALVNDGRDQPLLAAYRTESLRRELALLRTEYGSLTGLPLRLLLPELRLRRIDIAAGRRAATSDALDCDTWEDVAAARARIREQDTVLDEWTAAVKAELGIELDVDTATLLDVARDAAHGVARPAAPLTTFLVGYAAAQRGGSAEDVAEAADKAARLAARWAAESEEREGEQGDGR